MFNEFIQRLIDNSMQIGSVPVVFGLLMAFFAYGVAVYAHVDSYKNGKYIRPQLSQVFLVAFGLTLACFSTSTFIGIDVFTQSEDKYLSLLGVLLALLISFSYFSAFIIGLFQLKSNVQLLKVFFVVGGSLGTILAHALCVWLPQLDRVMQVDPFPLVLSIVLVGSVFLIQFPVFWKFWCERALSTLEQFKYQLTFTIGNLGAVLGVMGATEYMSTSSPLAFHWLPLLSTHYEFLAAVIGFVLILYFGYQYNENYHQRISELKEISGRLSDEKKQDLEILDAANRKVELTAMKVKGLEHAIESSNQNFDLQLDSLVSAVLALEQGVFEWDLESDRVKLSPSWSALLGFSIEEASHIDFDQWKEAFIDSDLDEWDEALEALLSENHKQAKFQMRYAQPQGGHLKIEFKLSPVRNAYGLVTKIVGMMEDRTAEMLLEMDVRDSLSEESRLSSRKSEFVSYLSHQIRTPMTVIASANAVLEASLKFEKLSEKRVSDHLDQVKHAIKLLRSLVDETLVFMGSDGSGSSLYDKTEVLVLSDLFTDVLNVESKRRSQPLPDKFKIQNELKREYKVLSNEVLLTNIFRQLISFVFDNPSNAELIRVSRANQALRIQLEFLGVPRWVNLPAHIKADPNHNSELDEPVPVSVDDDDIPFSLLLSRRVTRKLKGRFLVACSKNMLVLKVDIPLQEAESLWQE